MIRRNLLDLNVLIALTDQAHVHHQTALHWFISSGHKNLGICQLTEAGYVRVTMNQATRTGIYGLERSIAILQRFKDLPGYYYWPITDSWVVLTAPFAARISGHQQVMDACLLGLVIKENGVLVTLNKAVSYLAGPEYRSNVLVLE